ncbi:MAG: class I SAM-dependent methyltransferase [Cyanobacteria bacterium J06623_5]
MDNVASSMVNGLLRIKPLAKFAKHRARNMMMDRAESLGVYWRDEVKHLQTRGDRAHQGAAVNPGWEEALAAIANPDIHYPSYYTTSFHAYEEGNLGWLPAMEVDVAARAVHARIWPEGDARSGVQGDASLRSSFHQILKAHLSAVPERIVDLGCSAGASSFALQQTFPKAHITGLDLSAYFLAVAQYQAAKLGSQVQWLHAAAEETGLPDGSVDLASVCLVFHELPAAAAREVIAEAYRILRPGGHFAVMDMNPASAAYRAMPPYVLTLLKSTEPYLDQYFSLDMTESFEQAGFKTPTITVNSPRHRTVLGQKA